MRERRVRTSNAAVNQLINGLAKAHDVTHQDLVNIRRAALPSRTDGNHFRGLNPTAPRRSVRPRHE